MKRPVYIIKNITGSLVLKSFTTSFGGRRHPKVAKSNLKPREASHTVIKHVTAITACYELKYISFLHVRMKFVITVL